MIQTNIPAASSISAINARVDIQTNSTLVSCTCGDYLQEFVLHREGDTSKFFGFGISHKLDIILIDLDRKLTTIQRGDSINVALGSNGYFDYPYPIMYVTELGRNEKSNNVTCIAYDGLYKANFHTVSELNLTYPVSISGLITKCGELLGVAGVSTEGIESELLSIEFSDTLNFNGDEQVRILLDAIAEFTQSIYYINNQNKLVFKRLNKDADPVLTVTKEMYFELTTLTPRTLTGVCHATELGDNIATLDDSGIIQIMRNNPLYELNTNTATLLDEAAARISGLTIHQLDCEWDGNHLLEIGDKVAFVTEEDATVFTYVINDVIEYQGFINEITSWEYTQDETETATNPTNIGEKINQTVAKVDKVNKEITLMVSDVEEAKSVVSSLQLETGAINATVNSLETYTNESIDALEGTLETLTKEVNLKVDSDAVSISISKALENGVEKVKTASKQYTFDDTGLNISSSDSEISTRVTEDGMRVYKNDTEVLTADNQGVKATDLHARTFLIIGENSRLEDRGNRTACFWIGPAGG
jgi:hypothetical protein